MSAIKGHPNQKRQSHSGSAESFASVVQTDPKNRAGLDVLPKAIHKLSEIADTAEALDISPQIKNPELRIIKLTGASSAIRKGDIIRFDTGANKSMEIPVEKVETDYIYLAGELLGDPSGDDFFPMRHITLTIGDDGALSTSSGPVEFIKDGVRQQATVDTVDSSNNEGLPVQLVGSDGTTINLTAGDINIQSQHDGAQPDSIQIGDGTEILGINADNEALVHDADTHTEIQNLSAKFGALGQKASAGSTPVVLSSEQQTILSNLETYLASLDGKDYSTETTLAAILAKIIAAPSTEAKQDTIITNLGTLITELQAKADLSETQPVSLSSVPLATGAATEAKQDSEISILGDILTQLGLKADLSETQPVSLATAPLPTGAATEAKQDSIITELQTVSRVKRVLDSYFNASAVIPTATRLATGVTVPASTTGLELEIITKGGDTFSAYDAASGGNLIGRFTNGGGRLPCDLAAGVAIHLQSDTGADINPAQDLVINLIGA